MVSREVSLGPEVYTEVSRDITKCLKLSQGVARCRDKLSRGASPGKMKSSDSRHLFLFLQYLRASQGREGCDLDLTDWNQAKKELTPVMRMWVQHHLTRTMYIRQHIEGIQGSSEYMQDG